MHGVQYSTDAAIETRHGKGDQPSTTWCAFFRVSLLRVRFVNWFIHEGKLGSDGILGFATEMREFVLVLIEL